MADNRQDENVELIDDDEIITLTDDSGQQVKFIEEAVVEYQGEFYALLVPVDSIEGDDDGVYIFKVTEEDEENDVFEFVSDESVLKAVYDEYVKEVEKQMEEAGCECECGCGHHGDEYDDDCGCEHGHAHGGDGCGCEHGHKHTHGEHGHGCEHGQAHGEHGHGCGCEKHK